MTDLAENLTILQKNARWASEYISAIKLTNEKEKERSKIYSESVEGKKSHVLNWSFWEYQTEDQNRTRLRILNHDFSAGNYVTFFIKNGFTSV